MSIYNMIKFDEKKMKLWDENYAGKETKNINTVNMLIAAIAGRHNFIIKKTSDNDIDKLMKDMLETFTPVSPFKGTKVNIVNPNKNDTIEFLGKNYPEIEPGYITKANNGILLMNNIPEYRSSVLQSLRIPLMNKKITLSNDKETKQFDTKFQLGASAFTCPCGNYGSHDKVCLCSIKAIEQYEKKYEPLSNIARINFTAEQTEELNKFPSSKVIQKKIKNAYYIQLLKGNFNEDTIFEKQFMNNNEIKKIYDKYTNRNLLKPKHYEDSLKLATTFANTEGRNILKEKDFINAIKLFPPQYRKELQMENTETKIKELENQKQFLSESSSQFKEGIFNSTENGKSVKKIILGSRITEGLTDEQLVKIVTNAEKDAKNFRNENYLKNNNIDIENLTVKQKKYFKMFDELFKDSEIGKEKYIDFVISAGPKLQYTDTDIWIKEATIHAVNSGGELWQDTSTRAEMLVKNNLADEKSIYKDSNYNKIDVNWGYMMADYLMKTTNIVEKVENKFNNNKGRK